MIIFIYLLNIFIIIIFKWVIIGELSYGNHQYLLVRFLKNKMRPNSDFTEYSIKKIHKQDSYDIVQQKRIDLERKILSEVNHAFTIKFVKTLKNKNYLYK